MSHPATPRKRKRIPQEHYDAVAQMLISMVPYFMIQSQLAMRWSKPRKYVMEVIQRVHEDWASSAALVAETRRNQIRHGFEKIMMQATNRKKKDQAGNDVPDPALDVMVRVQRELGLLDGCYQPSRVELSGAIGVGVGISLGGLGFKDPDEVKARISELRQRLAAQGPGALTQPSNAGAAMAALSGATHLPNQGVIDIEEDPGGD